MDRLLAFRNLDSSALVQIFSELIAYRGAFGMGMIGDGPNLSADDQLWPEKSMQHKIRMILDPCGRRYG